MLAARLFYTLCLYFLNNRDYRHNVKNGARQASSAKHIPSMLHKNCIHKKCIIKTKWLWINDDIISQFGLWHNRDFDSIVNACINKFVVMNKKQMVLIINQHEFIVIKITVDKWSVKVVTITIAQILREQYSSVK